MVSDCLNTESMRFRLVSYESKEDLYFYVDFSLNTDFDVVLFIFDVKRSIRQLHSQIGSTTDCGVVLHKPD